MSDGFHTYREDDPCAGGNSDVSTCERGDSESSLKSGSSTTVVTVSTLVALLAMAMVFDAAGGRPSRYSDSRSSVVESVKKCDDESELPNECSLAGRLVRAARDFLGTGVPASAAWHFGVSSYSYHVFSTNPRAVTETVPIRIRWEASLDHLLNIPPPIFI